MVHYEKWEAGTLRVPTGELFNHADAKGFIKLYGLPVYVRALMQLEKKGGTKGALARAAAKTSATKAKTTRKK